MASYDKAYELVNEIKSSPEYKEYQKAKSEIQGNDTALSLLKELREKEILVQQAALLGQEPSEKDKEDLTRLEELTSIHSSISRFITQERQLMVILMDVQRIIAEGMNFLEI